ncbi:MAG: GMC family oxidoreductase [Acidobacteriota bacterium]
MKAGVSGFLDLSAAARDGALSVEADVGVIGSGTGGSLVAAELALAGRSVVVLEKGRHVPHEAMTQREFEMSARLYNDDLFRPAEGSGTRIPIVRGECLGGGSVVADAICHDPPPSLLASWAAMGLGSFHPDRPEIAAHLAAVRKVQRIGPVRPETMNLNNRTFKLAVERSGYSGRLVERNLPDGTCRQAGFCVQGCQYGDKQSALNTYIPSAIASGAAFLTECAVDRVERSAGGPFVVRATCRDRSIDPSPAGAAPPPLAVSLTCKRLVLAAGAIETPRVLLRSGTLDAAGLAGKGLSMHYQTFLLGHVPGVKVRGFEGLPVAYQCDEFSGWTRARSVPGAASTFWFDAAFSHPWNLATTFRFYGAPLLEIMDHYEELLGIMVYVTAKSRGSISESAVRFDIGDDDARTLRVATQIGAGLLFKVGARKVWTGATQSVLAEPADLARIREGAGYGSRDAFLYTSHPMGGACMGADAASSVCDEHGQVHGVPGLFVAVASAFPTPIGAPPYVSVMLHARRVAERIKAAAA